MGVTETMVGSLVALGMMTALPIGVLLCIAFRIKMPGVVVRNGPLFAKAWVLVMIPATAWFGYWCLRTGRPYLGLMGVIVLAAAWVPIREVYSTLSELRAQSDREIPLQ